MKNLTEEEQQKLKTCLEYCIDKLKQDGLMCWLIKTFPRAYSSNKEQLFVYNQLKEFSSKLKNEEQMQ